MDADVRISRILTSSEAGYKMCSTCCKMKAAEEFSARAKSTCFACAAKRKGQYARKQAAIDELFRENEQFSATSAKQTEEIERLRGALVVLQRDSTGVSELVLKQLHADPSGTAAGMLLDSGSEDSEKHEEEQTDANSRFTAGVAQLPVKPDGVPQKRQSSFSETEVMASKIEEYAAATRRLLMAADSTEVRACLATALVAFKMCSTCCKQKSAEEFSAQARATCSTCAAKRKRRYACKQAAKVNLFFETGKFSATDAKEKEEMESLQSALIELQRGPTGIAKTKLTPVPEVLAPQCSSEVLLHKWLHVRKANWRKQCEVVAKEQRFQRHLAQQKEFWRGGRAAPVIAAVAAVAAAIDKPGRGMKVCPGCRKLCSNRSSQCSCDHVFFRKRDTVTQPEQGLCAKSQAKRKRGDVPGSQSRKELHAPKRKVLAVVGSNHVPGSDTVDDVTKVDVADSDYVEGILIESGSFASTTYDLQLQDIRSVIK